MPLGEDGLLQAMQKLTPDVVGSETPTPFGLAAFCALACTFYILPVLVSFSHHRYWQAFIFAILAVIGVVYHLASTTLLGAWPFLASAITPCFFHRLAQLAALQVAFSVVGPEDPLLQRGNLEDAPSRDVLLCARAIPVIGIFAMPYVFGSFSPCASGASVEALFLLGFASFWFSTPGRRTRAADVLPRAAFWKRTWRLLVFPGFCLAPLLLALLATSKEETRATVSWQPACRALAEAVAHVGFALASARALRCVFGGEVEVLDRSCQNRLVVQYVMCGPALVLIPMVSAALAFDGLARGWRWPTLSMAATTPTSAAVLSMGSLPLAAASAPVFWVLRTISDNADTSLTPAAGKRRLGSAFYSSMGAALRDRIPFRNNKSMEDLIDNGFRMPKSFRPSSMGCHAGLLSICCGCGAALVVEGTPIRNAMHNTLTISFFLLLISSEVLLTIGSKLSGAVAVLRMAALVSLLGTAIAQLVLFVYVNQYIHNSYNIPHSIYALSEYATLGLLVVWPLTWVPEIALFAQEAA